MEKNVGSNQKCRQYYKFFFLLFFNFLNNGAPNQNVFSTEFYDKQIIFYNVFNKNS